MTWPGQRSPVPSQQLLPTPPALDLGTWGQCHSCLWPALTLTQLRSHVKPCHPQVWTTPSQGPFSTLRFYTSSVFSHGQFQNNNSNYILSKDNSAEICQYASLEGSNSHLVVYLLGSGSYYIFKTICDFIFRNGIREHYQFQLINNK